MLKAMDEIEYLAEQRRLAGQAVTGSLHDTMTWAKSGLPRQTVRYFPMLSYGLAVSGGFLLGRLIARRGGSESESEPESESKPRSGRSFMTMLKGIVPLIMTILSVIARLAPPTTRPQVDS